MVLHIFVFVFFLQIIKPNALVQRHFSVQPYKLRQYRNILNQVWIFSLPLLIFANVAETDSNFIYADITSFIVVLLSCAALLVISIRIFIRNLTDFANSSSNSCYWKLHCYYRLLDGCSICSFWLLIFNRNFN